MRVIELHRDFDVTGYSGGGKVVADGVEFDDGICVLHWRGEHRSTVVWPAITDVEAVNGHDGLTRIVTVAIIPVERNGT